MKFLIVVACVALIATVGADPPHRGKHGDKHKEKFAAIRESVQQCKESTNASDEVVEKIKNHENVEDPKGWCFEKCMCEKMEACDAQHKILPEKFLKFDRVTPEKLNPALEKCNQLSGADDCETVHKRFKCLYEEVPEARRRPHGPPHDAEHREKFAAVREAVGQCKESTNAPDDVVEKIKNHENIEDPKGWCFEKCMCEKLEVCDAEHKLVAEKFLKHGVSADKLNPAITKCNAMTGADDCETVHKRFKCLFEEVPEARHRPHGPHGHGPPHGEHPGKGHGRRGPSRDGDHPGHERRGPPPKDGKGWHKRREGEKEGETPAPTEQTQ